VSILKVASKNELEREKETKYETYPDQQLVIKRLAPILRMHT
jgi:hypothetical protein